MIAPTLPSTLLPSVLRTPVLVGAVLARRPVLRRRDRWTRDRLQAHQARELDRLRRHAYAHSPFYRRLHAGRLDAPLCELPVLTKAQLMEHFDEVSTRPDVRLAATEAYLARARGDELFRGRYYVAGTAGTTGRRGVFVWGFAEWVHVVSSYDRAFDWAGSVAGPTRRVKTAIVSSTDPSHQSARVGASIHSRWVPTLRLDAGEDPDSIVEQLNTWRPQMLIAYASMLRLLAARQLGGHLAIAPRFVFSASEVLTDSTRQLATQAWGTVPHDVYAATETAAIAAECGLHQGMHLFEDLVISEIVDEHDQPVPAGTYGAKVLVTVLFSRTLPLIRYEMSDSVSPAGQHDCPCGRPYALITGVQGREQEALTFPTAQGGLRAVHPIVFHHVMDPVHTAGWQINQLPDGELEVLLLPAGPVGPVDEVEKALVRRDLAEALTEQGVLPPPVRVRTLTAIPRTSLGKAPLVQATRPYTPTP
ncbi:coenzyme F390 synthetase [Pseudonocardia halophobica]|uniref:Coenzyme F390 synthetase n=1 Tax=Pseudonocardia halophobica TaxID=29401 RepID=A0A9W6L328_9PSEU|nr:phenylacetate--CoA ligase family protein [Pseudonocardia halophobica]GLL11211.1 coenzyme F390 synthetase [Pseudonocardia halophobica]